MINKKMVSKLAHLAIIISLFGLPWVSHAADFKLKNVKHLYDLKQGGGQKISLPTDVAANRQYVYVVDGTHHRVVVFDHQGKYQFSFGGGGQARLLEYPVGISTHGDRVYVADTNHHTVRIFDLAGRQVSSFKIYSEGREERPIDIKVTNNEIFVTCNNSQKVQVYNSSGKLLRSWGKRGKRHGDFRYPATIDNIFRGHKIVIDVLNTRAQIFSDKGKFVRVVGGQGAVAGKLFRPKGVAVDAKNRIYISDSVLNVIQVFNGRGELLYILGDNNKIRRFDAPAGLTVYNSLLYVSEVLGHKVSVYSLK